MKLFAYILKIFYATFSLAWLIIYDAFCFSCWTIQVPLRTDQRWWNFYNINLNGVDRFLSCCLTHGKKEIQNVQLWDRGRCWIRRGITVLLHWRTVFRMRVRTTGGSVPMLLLVGTGFRQKRHLRIPLNSQLNPWFKPRSKQGFMALLACARKNKTEFRRSTLSKAL